MGEADFERKALVKAVRSALEERARAQAEMRVTTPGGRFQVRWDENGSASALGQLAFFAEFLEMAGLFERWSQACPLGYTSPNAPEVRDVLGTWLFRYWMGNGATPTSAHCAATQSHRKYSG